MYFFVLTSEVFFIDINIYINIEKSTIPVPKIPQTVAASLNAKLAHLTQNFADTAYIQRKNNKG